jgi:cysteine desulfurase
MERPLVYLDNAATTRLDPEVRDTMLPFMEDRYGNPSSMHAMGLQARRAVEEARERCAAILETWPGGIVFTASGSEANNLLIKGSIARMKGRSVITTRIEHASVAEPLKVLKNHGIPVHFVQNDEHGRIDLNHLEDLLGREPCGLIAILHGSNEVGTLQDVQALCKVVRSKSPDTRVHLDSVQSVTHAPLPAAAWGIDSLALSSHKIHGPSGGGLLALYRDADLRPLVAGGGQESGRRSGTENVPAIVGTARALEVGLRNLPETSKRMAHLRDRLARGIEARIEKIRINGDPGRGLPHILSVSFSGLLGEVLLHHLEEKGIMVSTGSACHARWKDLSATIKALRVPDRFARGTIRFSLSKYTDEDEIAYTLDTLADRVAYLREVGI